MEVASGRLEFGSSRLPEEEGEYAGADGQWGEGEARYEGGWVIKGDI